MNHAEQSVLDKLERRIRRHLKNKTTWWKRPSKYLDGYVDGILSVLKRIDNIRRHEDRMKGHP